MKGVGTTASAMTGQCHCGRIVFTVTALKETVTICNCSICSRYNAVWCYFERQEVALTVQDDAAAAYRWNDKMIDFIHCRYCGCVTHYEDTEKTPESRVAINCRMLPTPCWEDIRVRHFDGAVTFTEVL